MNALLISLLAWLLVAASHTEALRNWDGLSAQTSESDSLHPSPLRHHPRFSKRRTPTQFASRPEPLGQSLLHSETGCDNIRLVECANDFARELGMNELTTDATEVLVQMDSLVMREGGHGLERICKAGERLAKCIGNQFLECLSLRNLKNLGHTYADGRTLREIVSTVTEECIALGRDEAQLSCASLSDGIYVDEKRQCAPEHYVCLDRLTFKGVCPNGESIEPISERCQPVETIQRCEFSRPSPPIQLDQIHLSCAGNGKVGNPKKACSIFYMECHRGNAMLRTCPSGLYFNAETGECDSPTMIADCNEKLEKVPEVSHEKPTPSANLFNRQRNPSLHQRERPQSLNFASSESGEKPFPSEVKENFLSNRGCDNERLIECGREFARELGFDDIPDDATELLIQLNNILLRNGPEGALGICKIGDRFAQCIDNKFLQCFSVPNLKALGRTYADGKTLRRVVSVLHKECSTLVEPSEEFSCNGKPNGIYLSSIEPCGQVHHVCLDELPYKAVCPTGQCIDLTTQRCQPVMTVSHCQAMKVVPEPQPTRVSSELSCENRRDGDYPNPTTECSAIYLSCSNGDVKLNLCDMGTYFDPRTRSCQDPKEIPQCRDEVPEVETSDLELPESNFGAPQSGLVPGFESSQREPVTMPGGECDNERLIRCGREFSLDLGMKDIPDDATELLVQLNAILVRHGPDGVLDICRMGDKFAQCMDNKYLECFAVSNLKSLGRTYLDGLTLRRIVSILHKECTNLFEENQFSCSHKSNGVYVNEEQPCGPVYYTCVDNLLFKGICPTGKCIDESNGRCMPLRAVPRCSKVTQVRPPPSRPKIVDMILCENRPNGNYPNPVNDCSSIYFSCRNGEMKVGMCDIGRMFDPESRECNDARMIRQCQDQLESIVPEDLDSLSTPSPDAVQPGAPQRDQPKPLPSRVTTLRPPIITTLASAQFAPESFETQSQVKPSRGQFSQRPMSPSKVPFGAAIGDAECDNERFAKCSSDFLNNLGMSEIPKDSFEILAHLNSVLQRQGDGLMQVCKSGDAFAQCIDNQFEPCFKNANLKKLGRTYADARALRELVSVLYKECTAFFKEQFGFTCQNRPSGIYVAEDDQCSQEYFVCTEGLLFKGLCNAGESIDSSTEKCRPISELARCSNTVQQQPLIASVPAEECVGLEDGDYPNPKKACSMFYISCGGGQMYWRACPMDLSFDKETATCASPSYVSDCGGNPSASTTPEPTTASSVQFDQPEPPVDCLGQPNGNFENPLNPCDAIYFTCDNGNALTKECPPGTYYDQTRDMCDFAEFVVACGGFPPEPTEAPPAEPTTPKRGPRFDCTNRPNGNYPDPTALCSDIFITCNAGDDNVRDCPPGMRYEEETDMCLEPAYVPACGGELTTPPPTEYPTEATPHPIFDCTMEQNKNFPDPQEQCSATFITCNGGQTFVRTCPGALRYDSERDMCDYPNYILECGGRPTEPTPTEPPMYDEPQIGYTFDCTGYEPGNYRDPQQECSGIYFTCRGDVRAMLRECPKNTYYDETRDMCDFADYVAACGGNPTEPTEAPPAAPTTPKRGPRFDCTTLADGNYPDPTAPCSDIFITCNAGEDNVRDCPPGMRYEEATDMCLEPAYVPACGGELTTPPPTEYPTESTPHPLFDCSMEPNQNFADPREECSATFITCNGGQTFVRTCPGALVYDRERDMCDYPNYILECGGTPTEPTTTAEPTARAPDNGYVYDCTGHEPGNYADPQNECSEIYYTCRGDLKGLMRECSPGTYYDEEMDMCVFYNNHPICSGTPRTSTEATTAPLTTPMRIPFNCPTPGSYPDPSQECSNMFISCSLALEPSLVHCPEGLYYDEELERCSKRDTIPKCSGRSRPEAQFNPPEISESSIDCKRNPEANFAPAGRCPLYYIQCSFGIPRKIECPSGSAFSEDLGICIQMDRVDSCNEF